MGASVKRCKTDARARVVLFEDFARSLVTVERVGPEEIRIRKLRKVRRFTLSELLAGVTPENIHAEVKTGPPVGKEVW